MDRQKATSRYNVAGAPARIKKMQDTIIKIFIFIFGSLIGSFLNVCIYRLPLEISIVRPRSFCPKCKKMIRWYDNVPFISYIVLKGKCRFCNAKISPIYFMIELLTAMVFLIFYNRWGLTYNFFFYIVFTCGLIIATFVDIQHRIIPDMISLGGIIVGFLLNTFRDLHLRPITYNIKPVFDSLLGIIIGGGIIYLTRYIFDLVYFKILKKPPVQGETQSMGDGDIKLLAMIGAFLGWQKVMLTFFLAPFLGITIGIINLIVKKDHIIPYGPFLSLAAVLSIFWANEIIRMIFVQ